VFTGRISAHAQQDLCLPMAFTIDQRMAAGEQGWLEMTSAGKTHAENIQ
jgi:hypothetical protein